MAHPIGYLKHGYRAPTVRAAWLVAIVAGLLCGARPALAQTPTIRFTVFSPQRVSDVVFAPRPGAEPQPLQFHASGRSPRYEYRGALPLKFAAAGTGAVVAEAAIPPNITDALLLFLPSADSGGRRFQIAVLDDAAARHGPGGLAIVNLSGLALGGTVNKESIALQPGLNPTLAIGSAAKITLHASVKGKTFRAYADTVQLGRNQRALLVLFPPAYRGSHEVQARLLIDQPPGAAGRPTAPK